MKENLKSKDKNDCLEEIEGRSKAKGVLKLKKVKNGKIKEVDNRSLVMKGLDNLENELKRMGEKNHEDKQKVTLGMRIFAN